jgi:hypothetical protein
MEWSQSNARSPFRAVALLAGAMLTVAGCGESQTSKTELRPPAPINVTAFISPKRVSVSPTTFGAGPIIVIVTNQSTSSQDATFETDELGGSRPGITQSTSPINPGDTGQIKVNVRPGTYRLRVGSQDISPAIVRVGAPRPSAQNQVLQP